MHNFEGRPSFLSFDQFTWWFCNGGKLWLGLNYHDCPPVDSLFSQLNYILPLSNAYFAVTSIFLLFVCRFRSSWFPVRASARPAAGCWLCPGQEERQAAWNHCVCGIWFGVREGKEHKYTHWGFCLKQFFTLYLLSLQLYSVYIVEWLIGKYRHLEINVCM